MGKVVVMPGNNPEGDGTKAGIGCKCVGGLNGVVAAPAHPLGNPCGTTTPLPLAVCIGPIANGVVEEVGAVAARVPCKP